MASSLNTADEQEHLPARSGTPTAWLTLILVAALILSGVFFDSIVCGVLRLGLSALAWNQRVELSIDHLALGRNGTIQAQGVACAFGEENHRSVWKSDTMEIQIASLGTWIGFSKIQKNHVIHEVVLGKTKLLLDRRHEIPSGTVVEKKARRAYSIPWIALLPDAASVGPLDLIVISDESRLSINGLRLSLPDRWSGRVAYAEAMLDVGSVHERFGAATGPANWNGAMLHLGKLDLSKELKLEELTMAPRPGRVEFGLRGTLGEGLLRGDGSFSRDADNHNTLAVTLVGENLRMDAATLLLKESDQRASGIIRQGRITFRGNLERPLEADCSLRLVADDFRWKGRGWDSLRLASTLTGRVFTLSELVLHQQENEVVAQGQSKLPEDWHQALKAPFIVSFHAQLDDAGALAALAGPDFAELSGGLELEGTLKGAENKAEGYCNLVSNGMKLRNLPIDWLKGCLLFEGSKTQLSNLEVWSGKDRVVMEGVVENSRPHTYQATAQFNIGNLTKRLAQIDISTASQIGGGAIQGTWNGDGSAKGHSGIFQAKVNDWMSPWTSAGMSGDFEGSYSPGHLYCSKAEFQAQDLKLDLQLSASPTQLEAKSIVATKKGKTDPLVQGAIALPVNAPKLWTSGALVENLDMKASLLLQLELHGIKVEELADLLGQKTPCTGTLAGRIAISGTPEWPEIHSTLKIAKLTLPDDTASPDLRLAFDASAGRATLQLAQDSSKSSALTLQAELPFHLIADRGALRFAERTAPIHAVVSLHSTPLNGWLTLWSGSPTVMRDDLLDGSVTLGGTVDHPSVEGSLTLTAGEAALPGLPSLEHLKLPISCALNKASATGGTALLGTNPVSLAGALDWSSEALSARLDLSGKNLPFPNVAGLGSRGDAEVTLSLQGTNNPLLSGLLTIRQISGSLPSAVMPSFVPPGIALPPPFKIFSSATTYSVQLDLQAKSEGFLKMDAGRGQLQAALHVQGDVTDSAWSGIIQAREVMLDLPAGNFVIPEATLQALHPGEEQLEFTAYGMTRQGTCTIQHTGSLQQESLLVDLLAPTATTSADVILALATSEETKAAPLAQILAWVRQNELFPTPASDWISRREGEPVAEALGFYGRPWNMTLRQQEVPEMLVITSLKENRRKPKN